MITTELSKDAKRRVELATVRLTGLGSQGVLVPGGFILTACHCMDWDGKGGMALGDYHREPFTTHEGSKLVGELAMAEPVSDLAAIDSGDGQVFYEEVEAYEEFVEQTEPVRIATELSDRVWILKKNDSWVEARLTVSKSPWNPQPHRCCVTCPDITSGDSGGPIVDGNGRLLSVVSCFSETRTEGVQDGLQPLIFRGASVWLLEQITVSGEAPQ